MTTPFIDFRPAQVMGEKEVYVCYYVLDPTSDKLKLSRRTLPAGRHSLTEILAK